MSQLVAFAASNKTFCHLFGFYFHCLNFTQSEILKNPTPKSSILNVKLYYFFSLQCGQTNYPTCHNMPSQDSMLDCKKHLAVKLNSTGLPISLVLFMADSPITLPLNSVLGLELGLKEKQKFFRLLFLHTCQIFIQLLLKFDVRQTCKKFLYAMLKNNMSHSDITLKSGKAEVKIQ